MPIRPLHTPEVPQLVVLVTGVIYTRIAKIGYALKSLGWHVVLLYSDISYINSYEKCFDEMHHYITVEEALSIARQYQPLVYHIFAVWEYDVALQMMSERLGPVVLDNYDTLAGMLKPDFINTRYPGLLDKEKLCIELADGLCCRNFELNYARRALKYRAKGKIIFFPEYCWGSTELNNDLKEQASDNREIHVVYAGNMNIEKQCRSDQQQMLYKNGFFLDFGRDLAAAGFHIHLYAGRINYKEEDFEDVFSEYLEAEASSPYFHIHRTLPEEKLIEEMSAYDLGIEATWLETETIGAVHSLPIRNRYGMSSKLFGYLDAGLGMILSENFNMRRWMFNRYGIVRTAYLDFVKEELLSTPPEFFKGLRSRSAIARKNYLLTKHAPRLAEFYFLVANSIHNKLFQNSSIIQPISDTFTCNNNVRHQERLDKIRKTKESMYDQILLKRSTPPDILSLATHYLPARSTVDLPDTILEDKKPIVNPEQLLCTKPLGAKMELRPLPEPNHKTEQQQKEEMNRSPHIFAIETTLACDLRCPECAIGGGMVQRTKGLMSFDQYKVIADKIRPYAQYVYPHIWGEPMLNPDIFQMIEYTSGFAKSNISTNGQSMTPVMAERLIKSGVTDIIVSIDGVTQDIYEQYRVGGNLKKALEALAMLQHFNSISGRHVNISPQFIVFKHNQHQIEDFKKISASLGLTPYFKPPYIRKKDSCFEYSDHPEYVRPHFLDLESLKTTMADCSSPKEVFNVLVDGTVVACCHDYGGFTNFGNIFSQDVMEIWSGPKMSAFRKTLASVDTPDFCLHKCMSYFLDESGIPEKVINAKISITTEIERMYTGGALKLNLCSGPVKINGYVGLDISPESDIILDLEKSLLPFPDISADIVACISAINYFSPERAQEIIRDVYRVLKPGGIARFACQDLRVLAEKYLHNDQSFYFEKLADGRDRFPGRTIADKFNGFFYGFYSGDKHCKYVYDFASLKTLFIEAGFKIVEQKKYRESRIPDVEKLDNRPEQMFFLEAVKKQEEGEYYRTSAFALLQKDPERAWQCLMMALEIDPADRSALVAALEILISHKRYDDAVKLCLTYLANKPVDQEISKFVQLVQQQAEQHNRSLRVLAHSKQPQMDRLDERRNRILSDQEHLEACMKWLRHAQDIHPGGGVSALYHMDEERWGVDYPETTGYIIPTFLSYADLTGDATWRTRALHMGDWEIAIQTPEGGAGEPVGVSGLRPRVFNTGQVLLGWVALYRSTSSPRFLTAACKAADWIISCQDTDGKWIRSTYSGQPKVYKSRVAWALLELFDVTGEERYRSAAELAVTWILAQAEPNGWFANNSLTEPEKPWTHLIGYVLVGLHEIYRLNNVRIHRANLLNLLHNAARNMASFYLEQKMNISNTGYTTLSGTFDRTWQSQDNWSCITGNAQIEFFLRRLYEDTKDELLKEAADHLLFDLKQLHLMDGITDPAFYGGLQGAYPVSGPYCTYLIPNWGVKFFADSLLQSIFPVAEKSCLG